MKKLFRGGDIKKAIKQIKQKESIHTNVPEQDPIELVEYYDDFLFYYPNCEMATKQWFVQNVKADWTILDCGANVGYFSILFSRLARSGHVYAFEPTCTYNMLLGNLKHNSSDNVTPLKIALGKKSGAYEDDIFRIWGANAERNEYVFTTIDDFVQTNKLDLIDCIKIDVDSFDFEVLQGAERTLQTSNPYVMVELNHALSKRNQSNTEALEWLASKGYKEARVFDYDNFLLKSGSDNSSSAGESHQIKLIFEKFINKAV